MADCGGPASRSAPGIVGVCCPHLMPPITIRTIGQEDLGPLKAETSFGRWLPGLRSAERDLGG